jgi:hypothetical protein
MSKARKVSEALLDQLEKVREEAFKKYPQRIVVAFDILAESLIKIERILEISEGLEKATGLSGKGIKRLCGNWLYVFGSEAVSLYRLKPVQSVTYLRADDVIRLANDTMKIKIGNNKITLIYRGYEIELNVSKIDDIVTKADLIKSLAPYISDLLDSLLYRLILCGKASGIQI